MTEFTAADLRRHMTVSEQILWEHLRAHRLAGFKFRRQHQIGRCIVDFVCLKKKIIVELDGEIHSQSKLKDYYRDQWLKRQGYTVLRFRNEELDQDKAVVLKKILNTLNS